MRKFQLLLFTIFCLNFFLSACTNEKKNREEILKEGSALFTKYTCIVCHSLDGNIVYGPPLNDIFLKKVEVIRNGEKHTVVADREYLKKAINDPGYEKVADYQNKDMPKTYLTDVEVNLLVDYLIALDGKNQDKN